MKNSNKPIEHSLAVDELEGLLAQVQDQQRLLQQQLDYEHHAMLGLAKRLWVQQEQERAYFARELHDDIGQQLIALRAQIDALQNPQLEQIQEGLLHLIESTRNLSRIMHPTILFDLGLERALTWLNRQLLEPANIQLAIHYDLSITLPNAVNLLLFRIAQETFVNSVKHAQASEIDLTISETSQGIVLKIKDDGIGFNVQSIEFGIGLQSLKDRALACGASLDIHSKPNCGCEVTLLLPYQQLSEFGDL
ncbi:sensor histidine kinase [Pseudidiomarina gelatinasegens]|uniref:histidine kinase n=1 Tax=Pseudidiomarina gelatinasegens TaxID=2487740 RepID=A0A443YZM5_9GAMM|nr:ATP-binding protein [Pseudidiomarina gelatinasegens]RWU09676.1 sensor histidine kinase [Pseudidiomarina gelatinasegens]